MEDLHASSLFASLPSPAHSLLSSLVATNMSPLEELAWGQIFLTSSFTGFSKMNLCYASGGSVPSGKQGLSERLHRKEKQGFFKG